METPRYEMIVWWSTEDEAFVVDVPELAGCMAHGSTRAEAIANAEEGSCVLAPDSKRRWYSRAGPKGASRRRLEAAATHDSIADSILSRYLAAFEEFLQPFTKLEQEER